MDQGIMTYREMLAAVVLQMVVYAVVGALISGQYILFPVSVIIGGLVAIAMLGSMRKTVETVLMLDPDTAKKYGRRQSIVRIALMGVILCAAFYFKEYVNPWGVFVGVFSLKFSAYLQPLVHAIFNKIMKRRINGK